MSERWLNEISVYHFLIQSLSHFLSLSWLVKEVVEKIVI